MTEKKILLIHCGGTIGMIQSEKGYTTKKGFFSEYVRNNCKLNILRNTCNDKQEKCDYCKNRRRIKNVDKTGKIVVNNMYATNGVVKQRAPKNTSSNTLENGKRVLNDAGQSVNMKYDYRQIQGYENLGTQQKNKLICKNSKQIKNQHSGQDNTCNDAQNNKNKLESYLDFTNISEKEKSYTISGYNKHDTHKNKSLIKPTLQKELTSKRTKQAEYHKNEENNIVFDEEQDVLYTHAFEISKDENHTPFTCKNEIKYKQMPMTNKKTQKCNLQYADNKILAENNKVFMTPNKIVYEIIELDKIIDSSNAQLEDYLNILELIKKNYKEYAGFVIIHGTDTMTYASSFISSMIKNLTKPIVFTGSITPMTVKQSKGINNIIKAITYANDLDKGVFVQFGHLICDGSRITKVSVDSENAFVGCAGQSFYKSRYGDFFKDLDYEKNHKHCADDVKETCTKAEWNNAINHCPFKEKESIQDHANIICSDGMLVCKNNNKHSANLADVEPIFYDKFDDRIAIIKIYPNIKKCVFEAAIKHHRAIILETFGTGNGLGNNKEVLDLLEEFIKDNNYVINVSQCLNGFVTDDYEANSGLTKIGVISGRNMTSDALFCHLASILGNFDESETKYEIMNLIDNW